MAIKNILIVSLTFCLIKCITALYEECNHVVNLRPGEKIYINSPYYPDQYPIGTSCRYTVTAPLDHELSFKCNIRLSSVTTRCLNEVFYFNREGSEFLTDSEYFCGSGTMERKSFLNKAVISYISTPIYKRNLPKVSEAAIKTTTASTTKSPTFTATSKETLTTVGANGSGNTTSAGIKVQQVKTEADLNNALAYVVALLSNNFDESDYTTSTSTSRPTPTIMAIKSSTIATRKKQKKTNPPATSKISSHSPTVAGASNVRFSNKAKPTVKKATPTTTAATTTRTATKKTKSLATVSDVLSSITWQHTSIMANSYSLSNTSMTSSKRGRIVSNSAGYSLFNGANGVGGGAFSCLVEVIEPQCDCGWSMSTKIAGISSVAGVHEFPSMAGVLTVRFNKIFCGAAIIHHRYLLSAAHCFLTGETNRTDLIRIVVGEHDVSTLFDSVYTRTYEIESITPHEYFRSTATNVRNDIALLRTRYSMEWNRAVGPACLPFRYVDGSKPPRPGQQLVTAGWGTTTFGGAQSSVLLKTTLDVISLEQCRRRLQSVPPAAFCTYTPGTDTCQYDSGGALYARGNHLFAIGIISYGFACASQQPSVNTKIASYLKWIRNKTPEVRYCIK
ncbi:uncharacterized protein LOC119683770 [Teleopsis dalmanni]|uniref:uncharacterized protein LOC119683770 n=1 Tax=Teleopsis dalmanni TaxID=139649 RepID=UPI0018CF7D73|nr:uncharacterized protein LOC119683770 [Teleopsis dalmanni]